MRMMYVPNLEETDWGTSERRGWYLIRMSILPPSHSQSFKGEKELTS